MQIYTTYDTDIYRNLAREESLLVSDTLLVPALFLWQSGPAVVIGRHQNPWKECLVDELNSNNIPIARRISGGGAVFHDAGNLNYTVITDRASYNAGSIYQMITDALAEFAVTVEIRNRSSLYTDNRKFSGNAFTFRKKRAMHHGTLLVNSNLEQMNHFLSPQYENIKTKAVASNPADVVNLNSLNPAITIASISDAVKRNFISIFKEEDENCEMVTDNTPENEKIAEFAERLRSKEWIFDKTPSFTV